DSRHQICVTLNRHDDIDPAAICSRIDYDHPVFDAGAIAAQRRRPELQGRGGLFWSGAWWGYGFHEDGARSGVDVARLIEAGA
ncbi:MAG: NAD(P)/FAD-dependent oxidoreductase, partial [Acidimicrobiales bacterium]